MRTREKSDSLEQATRDFMAARPQLFGIAYRVLGSAAEAEDIVQEAWLRWQAIDHADVQEPTAFLTTITTRLSINCAKSARMRRESYIGPWLPEPVDTSADPQLGAERAEVLDMAVLFLLEKLNPVERAAYVLREAFAYPYKKIADILETNEPHTRQLVSRARKHLAAEHREPVSPAAHHRLLKAFVAAAQSGDLASLEELLAADVVSYADGAGIRGASKIPIVGRPHVSKTLVAYSPRFWPEREIRWVEANGRPAALVTCHGAAVALVTADVSERGIERIMWVVSPAKLANYAATLAD
ncbi:RNA polymerase sigma-70 factor [Actinacidiphila glaucinigra]|uniref:RNA polymerase sigma-70 factor, ECF subfamily n=1 Tax=Actinacidiphila glaucinigra TaxID=235986 RepID=A0A239JTC8_9ACTN|nr:RNA polymerase sigma-70 factor [Actinacidiphila glaucinigra]SNT08094.1 RNA polymerase sigma-70 factor, ECF subfamily [Actinacidiphila glaucinigra]